MENSAPQESDPKPEKSEARKQLETYALLAAISISMDESEAAEERDREAMRDLDQDAEEEREKDRADAPVQNESPGFRRRMFPVKARWVMNKHYEKDPRTGREFWIGQGLGWEIVKEVSIELAEVNRWDFVAPECVMMNSEADPVVRRHVVTRKPGSKMDPRNVRSDRQPSRELHSGVGYYEYPGHH